MSREEDEYRGLLPLAVLYTRGRESIDGAMRFQKMVFLGQEEADFPDLYTFQADDFGPFSPRLHKDIYWLIENDYAERDVVVNSAGNERHVFRLTTEGIRRAQTMLQKDRFEPLFETADSLKEQWGDERIERLLKYVYNKYEDYTSESELDVDRLFDEDARSQFLEPCDNEEDEYLGPGPGAWRDLNPSAEDLFSID